MDPEEIADMIRRLAFRLKISKKSMEKVSSELEIRIKNSRACREGDIASIYDEGVRLYRMKLFLDLIPQYVKAAEIIALKISISPKVNLSKKLIQRIDDGVEGRLSDDEIMKIIRNIAIELKDPIVQTLIDVDDLMKQSRILEYLSNLCKGK